MNLYGESGNVKALKRFIERQGVDVEIHFLTLYDKIDFKKYDLLYLGAGSEESEYMVLGDLYKYKDDIKQSIEDGKFWIATGNAMEIFGSKIRLKNDRPIECLGIFDFNAIEAPERLVSELTYEFEELGNEHKYILGFKNCNSSITNNSCERPFKYPDNIHYKNFYGMMFVGPVLVRNPYFTDHILEQLFKDKGLEYKPDYSASEYKAYHKYIENFISTKEN